MLHLEAHVDRACHLGGSFGHIARGAFGGRVGVGVRPPRLCAGQRRACPGQHLARSGHRRHHLVDVVAQLPGEGQQIPLPGELQQVVPQRGRVGVALVRVVSQRPHDDGLQVLGVLLAHLARLGDVPLGDPADVELPVVVHPGQLAGGQLVQHHAQGEDVGPVVDGPALVLLGGHVLHLALDHPHRGQVGLAHELGDAEVGELYQPLAAAEHVVRADVAVDDVQRPAVLDAHLPVCVVQPEGRLGQHPQGDAQRDAAVAVALDAGQGGQVAAVHVLHGDEVRPLVAAELEDLHHVWVAQLGRDARLVQQHLGHVLHLGVLGQQPLDHHHAPDPGQPLLAGQEYLGHAPLADPAYHAVVAAYHLAGHVIG